MEAAAFFLLIIAIAVIAALGAGVYVLAMRLRASKLDPEEDKVEHTQRHSSDGASAQEERPEHLGVESEQHVRSSRGPYSSLARK